MATSTTSNVYIHVVEDVINKVRDEFASSGDLNETVLNELQGLWEMKMMQAGIICGPIDRSASKPVSGVPLTPTTVHDLNVPYEGPEEYETPTAEMLFPPTPLQTPMPTPLPGSVENSLYNIPTGNSDYNTSANDGGGGPDMKVGRPSPYMQPPSPWMNQRPPLDVNVAYEEGRDEADRGNCHQPLTQDFFMMSSGKRKREDFASQYHTSGYIPQQDGAGDVSPEAEIEVNRPSNCTGRRGTLLTTNRDITQVATPSMKIPQLDGPVPDPYDDMLSTPNIYNYQGVVNEDYSMVNTPAPNDLQVSTPAIVAQNDVVDDDDEEPLNENDDDDLDDVDQGEELNTQHLVLAQFDKVTRTKSRWKCTLKDGIMHINNKDIPFNKATGEFEF